MMRPFVKPSVFVLFYLFLLTGCSSSHVILYKEDVSRDYTYISFTKNKAPFSIQSIVGGEHVSVFKVLAFEGEVYDLRIDSIVGEAYHTIYGEGVQIIQKNAEKGNAIRIRIIERETIFNINIYSHPFAEYELIIRRI